MWTIRPDGFVDFGLGSWFRRGSAAGNCRPVVGNCIARRVGESSLEPLAQRARRAGHARHVQRHQQHLAVKAGKGDVGGLRQPDSLAMDDGLGKAGLQARFERRAGRSAADFGVLLLLPEFQGSGHADG